MVYKTMAGTLLEEPELAPGRASAETPRESAPAAPTLKLGHVIPLCMLTGLIGLAVGGGALSSTFSGGPGDLISMVPLVMAVVAIVSGWVGAVYWMCQSEKHRA